MYKYLALFISSLFLLSANAFATTMHTNEISSEEEASLRISATTSTKEHAAPAKVEAPDDEASQNHPYPVGFKSTEALKAGIEELGLSDTFPVIDISASDDTKLPQYGIFEFGKKFPFFDARFRIISIPHEEKGWDGCMACGSYGNRTYDCSCSEFLPQPKRSQLFDLLKCCEDKRCEIISYAKIFVDILIKEQDKKSEFRRGDLSARFQQSMRTLHQEGKLNAGSVKKLLLETSSTKVYGHCDRSDQSLKYFLSFTELEHSRIVSLNSILLLQHEANYSVFRMHARVNPLKDAVSLKIWMIPKNAAYSTIKGSNILGVKVYYQCFPEDRTGTWSESCLGIDLEYDLVKLLKEINTSIEATRKAKVEKVLLETKLSSLFGARGFDNMAKSFFYHRPTCRSTEVESKIKTHKWANDTNLIDVLNKLDDLYYSEASGTASEYRKQLASQLGPLGRHAAITTLNSSSITIQLTFETLEQLDTALKSYRGINQ